jgi:hypothetical protein
MPPLKPVLVVALLGLAAYGCGPADHQCSPDQSPDVEIRVVDDTGTPRCDAIVVLTSAAQAEQYQPTGRSNDCSLYTLRIPVATYDLAVSAPGYPAQRSKLTVAYADEACGTWAVSRETITLKK